MGLDKRFKWVYAVLLAAGTLAKPLMIVALAILYDVEECQL